jgi:hypothetical protein
MKFLGVPWGLRPRRTEQKLALPLLSMLPSAHVNRVGVRVVSFRGSMATPPILYLRFAGSLAVAAQDSRPSGSLLLSCKALSSSTSCRFIPRCLHEKARSARLFLYLCTQNPRPTSHEKCATQRRRIRDPAATRVFGNQAATASAGRLASGTSTSLPDFTS